LRWNRSASTQLVPTRLRLALVCVFHSDDTSFAQPQFGGTFHQLIDETVHNIQGLHHHLVGNLLDKVGQWWSICGTHAKRFWNSCGTFGTLQRIRALNHISVRSADPQLCGTFVEKLWDICGAFVEPLWSICGTFVEHQWSNCGTSVEFDAKKK